MRGWDWFFRLYLDQKDPKLIKHLDNIFIPTEEFSDEASDEEESSEDKKSIRIKREAEVRKTDKTLMYIISVACEKCPEARSHLVCFDGENLNANSMYTFLMGDGTFQKW